MSENKILKRDGARTEIQLARPSDAYLLWRGMTLSHVLTSSGIEGFIRYRLPWFFPRVVVVTVDVSAGIVTSEVQSWSWRRWKWEARR